MQMQLNYSPNASLSRHAKGDILGARCGNMRVAERNDELADKW
jgi:hypothetical protein